MTRARGPAATVKPRIRVMRGGAIVLGPGRADLLEAVRRTGSIRDAARSLGMSYMRAWELVKSLNAEFSRPLVTMARGGAAHGGASLTAAGLEVLALYRAMEAASLKACAPAWRRLSRRLR
jgi:molybdate transport system regulatory protein